MCGIFGYVGKQTKQATTFCLAGLKRLEYRGYDSAGLAGVGKKGLLTCKSAGKVAILSEKVEKEKFSVDTAIGHTRWATHGKPNDLNAHPHLDAQGLVAVVHNGIIENHDPIRAHLQKQGIKFVSETDSEVIAQLIGSLYKDDLLKAVQQAMPMLEGSFAIALVHRDHPHQIIAAAKECPLVIGIGNGEAFVSSDTSAFLVHTDQVAYLHDSEVAVITAEKLKVYDEQAALVVKKTETVTTRVAATTKGSYPHYMLKEIHEQAQSIRNAALSRYLEEEGTAQFDGLHLTDEELKGISRILIIACGTSWHAGMIATYMIEDLARIPVQIEISSEFRYKNPIVEKGTLAIAISQSGETADTLAAMRELKRKGAKVVAICNVHGSTIAREADSTLFLRAGPEIGVASTKAFTSQLVVLSLFALMLARRRDMSKQEGQRFLTALKAIPGQIRSILRRSEEIQQLAKHYSKYNNFFYLGRRYMFPTCLEGALKLKEISYINANGYPAGEMKHGPIALIDEECATVACCADRLTMEKIFSNLMEIKARGGPILAIVEEGVDAIFKITKDVITVPKTIDELAPILTTVILQLLAYYISCERGTEIDQPRNLAKSVTVE